METSLRDDFLKLAQSVILHFIIEESCKVEYVFAEGKKMQCSKSRCIGILLQFNFVGERFNVQNSELNSGDTMEGARVNIFSFTSRDEVIVSA